MFVLGFAASSFAIHAEIPAETQAVVASSSTQITIGGEIRVRGRMVNNVSDFNSDTTTVGDNSFYDSRIRLQVEAKVTPNTTGLIQLEAGDNTHDTTTWGSEGSAARGIINAGDSKQNQMSVLQAWILHQGTGLLGVPALIKIGHMPIQIDGLFYSHTKFGDDAILLGVDPVKELHIILGTVKLGESSTSFTNPTTYANPTTTTRDINGYTAIVSYAINKDSVIGADLTYADGQNLTPASYNIFAEGHGVNPAINGGLPLGNGVDIHLWNLAINGKTRVAGLGIKAEVDVQHGKAVDTNSVFVPAGTGDLKFRGYAAKLDLDYKINPVTLLASAAYGSGDDYSKLLGNIPGGGFIYLGDHKIRNFVTTLENIQHFTLVYEYFTPNAAGNISGGLENTWYLNLGAKADIMKSLDGMINIYYLRAVHKTVAGIFDNQYGSKSIGTEVDVNLNYQIDKNLKYYVEGGYLFAGNFWKNLTPVDAAGHAKSPDDAYVIRHGIQLSF